MSAAETCRSAIVKLRQKALGLAESIPTRLRG